MFRKIIFSFVALTLLLGITAPALAQEQDNKQVNLYFFHSIYCPHCKAEDAFLEKLRQRLVYLNIYKFEISQNQANANKLQVVGQMLGADVSGVPLTVVGEKYISGYRDEASTGFDIEKLVEKQYKKQGSDPVGVYLGLVEETENIPSNNTEIGGEEKIRVPVFGEIDPKNFSLPLLSVIIGTLDGFNPCAMWTLMFLISLLLGMENKKRMWILGGAFIFASAFVYFLFMSAWLNLFLFLGVILWVRLAIGLVALFSGG